MRAYLTEERLEVLGTIADWRFGLKTSDKATNESAVLYRFAISNLRARSIVGKGYANIPDDVARLLLDDLTEFVEASNDDDPDAAVAAEFAAEIARAPRQFI